LSSRLRRFASAASAAALLFALIAVAPVSAKTPGWQFIDGWTGVPVTDPISKTCPACQPFTTSPATVSPNALAAFKVTIKNAGSSNISALYLSTSIPASNPAGNPVYIFPAVWTNETGPTAPCRSDTSLPLYCSFGSLNSGATVTVEIVFQAPAASLSFNFRADGNGNTPSDGGTSHGDTLLGPTGFNVSTSKDFSGGFDLNGGTPFQTNNILGKKNIQSTAVTSNRAATPVTVTDGLTTFPVVGGTDPCLTVTCVGDWAIVSVGDGTVGPVEVTITIYGQTIHGNPALSSFGLWHEGSSPNPITLPCSDPSSIPSHGGDKAYAECITVQIVGNNYVIDAWLKHNGSGRGVLFG